MTQSKFPAPIKRKRGRPRFVPTDAQRERVVALKAVGATNETVAKILGTSVGTAKVRALRARERLRQILNGGGTHGGRD